MGTSKSSSPHLPTMASSSNQPNNTLYLNNLNDKVNKEELKIQLYALFTTYGKIIDIVASKSQAMRGQAFLVFNDLAGATSAMRACEGMMFYEKPIVSLSLPMYKKSSTQLQTADSTLTTLKPSLTRHYEEKTRISCRLQQQMRVLYLPRSDNVTTRLKMEREMRSAKSQRKTRRRWRLMTRTSLRSYLIPSHVRCITRVNQLIYASMIAVFY